jgi:GTP-binding protein HflX
MVSRLHEIGDIESEDYREDGIYLSLNLAAKDKHLIAEYILERENH